MRKLLAQVSLVAIGVVTVFNSAVFAKPEFPLSSFNYKEYYTNENYIPSCVSGGSCAIFVSSSGGKDDDNTNDGTKSKPYKSLTHALTKVTLDKNIIAVAEGTYDGNSGENFPLGIFNDVQILGGFYDEFKERDNSRDAHKSIISLKTVGDNSEPETGFYINSSSVVIDGFEIKDGDLAAGTISDLGGAVQVETFDEDVAITNNTFIENQAERGGAVYTKGKIGSTGHILVAGNVFKSNEADLSAGGAVYSRGGTVIVDNVFDGNKSALEAAAVYATGDTVIVGNVFKNNGKANPAEKGGAISADGDVGIFNNFFAQNGKESAVYAIGNVEIVNNTVVKSTGHGIQVGGNDVKVVNNLVAYNGEKGVAPLVVSITGYTNENNVTWKDGGISKGAVECDPKFANENSTDPESLKIGAGSECIDKGQEYGADEGVSVLLKDFFGNDRKVDGNKDGSFATDPGAHEVEGDAAGEDSGVSKTEIKNLAVKGNVLPAVVSFETTEEATITVRILKGSTEMSKLVENKKVAAGKHSYDWDQKDSEDKLVDYGKYKAVVKASNAGGDVEKEVEFDLTKPDPNAQEDEETTEDDAADDTSDDSSSDGDDNVASDGNFKNCAGFIDVVDGSAICESIKYVKEKGYFEGYEDGSFGYDRPITRAEVLKVVFVFTDQKLLDDDGTNLGFDDLSIGAWYMKYIRTAKEFKIVEGYDDGTYKPNKAVARNEFLKIFFKSADKEVPKATVAPYADVKVDATTSWYVDFVAFVQKNVLMDTDKAGNFKAGSEMTRGDVAEFLYRYSSM